MCEVRIYMMIIGRISGGLWLGWEGDAIGKVTR